MSGSQGRKFFRTVAFASRVLFGRRIHRLGVSTTGLLGAALALALLLAPAGQGQDLPAPQPDPLPGLAYKEAFFPNAKYDPNVPTPDSVLGFAVGSRPATHAQIESVFKALGAKSPRCKLFEYGKTHEGRALYYMVIASEANLNRLDSSQGRPGQAGRPAESFQRRGGPPGRDSPGGGLDGLRHPRR